MTWLAVLLLVLAPPTDKTDFPSLKPGSSSIAVKLEDGAERTVFLRVPAKYDPKRAWPMIVAYHGTGGGGRDLIGPLEHLLGQEVDQFIIAGPDQYQPANIDSKRSWRPEHRLVLQTLRKQLHIDSDRVYVTGFSGGGYVAWSLAMYYGDEYAAAIPVACAFDAAPEIPGVWQMLLPNVQNIPVLNVWGADDRLPVLSIDLTTPAGTNNELNTRLRDVAKELKLGSIQSCELPNVGHAFAPPAKLFKEYVSRKREHWPKRVEQRFRYLNQGRAYWLEALSWQGDQWGLGPRELPEVPGQSREQAIAKMLDSTLARLAGTIDGQNIIVERKHVGRLVVWIGEGMIDFEKPVRLSIDGKIAFEGIVKRDEALAKAQANRTRDFARLRWAGLLVDEAGVARPISAADEFPEVVWEKPGQ